MVTVLIHQGWGNPMKHKFQWVNTCSGSGGNASARGIPLLGGPFNSLVDALKDESGGTLRVFGGLGLLL